MNAGCAVLVDPGDDPLPALVAEDLAARGADARRLRASELAEAPLALTGDGAALAGAPIRSLFFAAPPGSAFAAGFVEDDAPFSTQEVGACWLAVTGLPGVTCVNRLDPELWYTTAEWSVWRRRLEEEEVKLAPLGVGDIEDEEPQQWLPWSGGVADPPAAATRRAFATALAGGGPVQRTVRCCGEWVRGEPSDAIRRGAAVLERRGVTLLEVLWNSAGIVTCGAWPALDGTEATFAASTIGERLVEGLRSR